MISLLRHLDASTQSAGPPQDIYDGLKAMAAHNHHSMQEQARLLIEREVRLHQPGAMERARSWRERMSDRPMPQLLEDLRADRDR